MPDYSVKVDFYNGSPDEYEHLSANMIKEGFEKLRDLNNQPTNWYILSADEDADINHISAAVERAILDTLKKFSRKLTKDYYTIVTPSITLNFKLKELLKKSHPELNTDQPSAKTDTPANPNIALS
jgi:hypothetical protein